jgi:hypothetical protein
MICRARVNDESFPIANKVSDIGAKIMGVKMGRANLEGYPIFYGANSKHTAACEILQRAEIGVHQITVGCWEYEDGLWLVNMVDGADNELAHIDFVGSKMEDLLKTWKELPKQSAMLLFNYFKNKFKQRDTAGVYAATNILARIAYCLEGVDGICYGSISNSFHGLNVAVKNFNKLKCRSVERWLILKDVDDEYKFQLLQKGKVLQDGNIQWRQDIFRL